jgi:hypothetical protein
MMQMKQTLLNTLGFALLAISAVIGTPPSLAASETGQAHIEYSQSPAHLLMSFREILPEYAEQDKTPLVRVFGDGRVLVYHPHYMKQAGEYEMRLSDDELNDLLLQVSSALIGFNAKDVKQQMRASDQLLEAAATRGEEIMFFAEADAEISVFEVNISSYQTAEGDAEVLHNPVLRQSWEGLRFDAADYVGIEPIQKLKNAGDALKALSKRAELVRVEGVL